MEGTIILLVCSAAVITHDMIKEHKNKKKIEERLKMEADKKECDDLIIKNRLISDEALRILKAGRVRC